MSVIYFNTSPNEHGGGPSIFVHKAVSSLSKKGHRIIYNNIQSADIALCIISVGNKLKKINKKAKLILRIDGIYNAEYNKKFNRAIRPDMIALHDDLKINIPKINHTVYQSQWSRDRIWDEIVKVDRNYSIIHNGVNTDLFKPTPRKSDGWINLTHIGLMRDSYLMEMLVGTYNELKRRGHKVRLMLTGSMDGGCQKVLVKNMDTNIHHFGKVPNSKVVGAFNKGDIYLDVRQGASCNNTVAEAQSCGLPVVTAKWGGSGEMIVDGQTGIIVDSGRWDYDQNYIKNLANGVEQIIPDLNGFKTRARNHAVKNLTIDKMINKYIKVFGI